MGEKSRRAKTLGCGEEENAIRTRATHNERKQGGILMVDKARLGAVGETSVHPLPETGIQP
jgi:hypothetical protein